MGLAADTILDLDVIYLTMGDSDVHRRSAYLLYIESESCEADVEKVQDGIRGSRPTGQAEFVRALERKLHLQIEPQRRGRLFKCSLTLYFYLEAKTWLLA
ncbi:hypothetical protein AKG08_16300 [Achromobacter piechaudii]|nr:hypothetical protein AKG08_16300 [Achromobacter piechaudii]